MNCKVNGELVDLKIRLIENTIKLLEHTGEGYSKLIDYNRQLFEELYDLDIFLFVPKNLVDDYTGEYQKPNPYLKDEEVIL